MFSRLARQGFELHKPLILKYQPLVAMNTAAAANTVAAGKDVPPIPSQPGQRDLVNFPRIVRAEYAPPVRHFMIPESWFQAFYPKTGVTGPYMFFVAFSTFLLSKEIVVEEGLPHVLAWFLLLTVVKYKYGDKIAAWSIKEYEEEAKKFDEYLEAKKHNLKVEIKAKNESIPPIELIEEVAKAKRENIYLQMEGVYRERLTEVYKKVKKQLDFQVELENVERRIAQKNLSDYVIRKVLSSITPEQEKNMMQTCIQNLNSLAVKL